MTLLATRLKYQDLDPLSDMFNELPTKTSLPICFRSGSFLRRFETGDIYVEKFRNLSGMPDDHFVVSFRNVTDPHKLHIEIRFISDISVKTHKHYSSWGVVLVGAKYYLHPDKSKIEFKGCTFKRKEDLDSLNLLIDWSCKFLTLLRETVRLTED